MIALDTSVLIYANRPDAPLHDAANRRLQELAAGREPWALPVVCAWGFVRITTQTAFDPPTPLEQAFDFLDQLLQAPNLRLLNPGARHTVLLRRIALDQRAHGRLFTDAVIVALCREHGFDTILTDDRDFLRFPGITVELLTG